MSPEILLLALDCNRGVQRLRCALWATEEISSLLYCLHLLHYNLSSSISLRSFCSCIHVCNFPPIRTNETKVQTKFLLLSLNFRIQVCLMCINWGSKLRWIKQKRNVFISNYTHHRNMIQSWNSYTLKPSSSLPWELYFPDVNINHLWSTRIHSFEWLVLPAKTK
jgi:hypothetical protein